VVTKLDRTRSFANQAYLDFSIAVREAIVFDWRKALHPDDLEAFYRRRSRANPH